MARPGRNVTGVTDFGLEPSLKSVALGITRSQCILRRPLLIMGFWAAVAAADAGWLLFLR